jgi:hypothetical protein
LVAALNFRRGGEYQRHIVTWGPARVGNSLFIRLSGPARGGRFTAFRDCGKGCGETEVLGFEQLYDMHQEVIVMRATAIKLERAEQDALERMVKVGLFPSRDEAARAPIIKYAADLGLMSPDILWQKITRHKRRKVTPAQLMRDIEAIAGEPC